MHCGSFISDSNGTISSENPTSTRNVSHLYLCFSPDVSH